MHLRDGQTASPRWETLLRKDISADCTCSGELAPHHEAFVSIQGTEGRLPRSLDNNHRLESS